MAHDLIITIFKLVWALCGDIAYYWDVLRDGNTIYMPEPVYSYQ